MHPEAFQIGSLTIHWYGIMVALGFLAGLWTAGLRAPKGGVNGEKIVDLGPWLIVGAIVGARTLYVLTYWDNLFSDPKYPGAPWTEVFMIRRGGLVYYGGLIGSSLACLVYCLVRKLPVWKVADVLAPSIALGYAFGRVGCLLNGCCYGRTCELPWAIHFPPGHEPDGAPVHPTQIYDSLLSFGLYAGLAWLFRKKKFDGQVFAAYLLGYAVLRSFVEIFRGDYTVAHLHGGLTPAHIVSIGIFFVGAVLFWILRMRKSPAQ
jgi:phosphatidylglycerol:prolipoprotein diacylglycerol transferase